MSDEYLVKRGQRHLGPYSLQQMRAMIRSAELGKMYPVSKDGGDSWLAAARFPELWEVRDLAPLPPPNPAAAQATPPPESGPATPTVVVATPTRSPTELAIRESEESLAGGSSPPRRGGWGMGLAGFITTLTGLVLSLVPTLIWVMRYPSAYAFVPLAFPLLGASITGLALSTVAMSRRGGAFALTGMIIGICGSLLGFVTAVGWTVSSDPREAWIDRLTKTQDADLQLARRTFDGSLRRYQESSGGDRQKARVRLTKDFMLLTEAHFRLVKVAASTPRFRQHFDELEGLRVAWTRFQEALANLESVDPTTAILGVGDDIAKLRILLDMQELYRTGQVTLDMAQAKFRDL
jgi:hypothetical protein